MDKWRTALQTSEFWVGLVGAALQFLVAQGLVPAGAQDFINGAVVYVVGRLISKFVKPAPAPPVPPVGG